MLDDLRGEMGKCPLENVLSFEMFPLYSKGPRKHWVWARCQGGAHLPFKDELSSAHL